MRKDCGVCRDEEVVWVVEKDVVLELWEEAEATIVGSKAVEVDSDPGRVEEGMAQAPGGHLRSGLRRSDKHIL